MVRDRQTRAPGKPVRTRDGIKRWRTARRQARGNADVAADDGTDVQDDDEAGYASRVSPCVPFVRAPKRCMAARDWNPVP
jgi:hypothetical protein